MLGSEEFPSSPRTEYRSTAPHEPELDEDGCEICRTEVKRTKPVVPGTVQTFRTVNNGYQNFIWGLLPVKEEQQLCPTKANPIENPFKSVMLHGRINRFEYSWNSGYNTFTCAFGTVGQYKRLNELAAVKFPV
jgi:hypothetical protein